MYKPSSISADRQTSALKDEVDDIEKLIITWTGMKPVLIDALENSPVCYYNRLALSRKTPWGWHSNWHLRIALPPIFYSQITKTWVQYDCINSCADIRCTTQCPLEDTFIYRTLYYIIYCTHIYKTRLQMAVMSPDHCTPHAICILSTFRLCSPSKLIVLRRYSRGWECKHLGL
jgi:hypothetical protein